MNMSKKRVTSIVESKFKKRKKQRFSGFYTFPLVRWQERKLNLSEK